jgi:hypothetical protein
MQVFWDTTPRQLALTDGKSVMTQKSSLFGGFLGYSNWTMCLAYLLSRTFGIYVRWYNIKHPDTSTQTQTAWLKKSIKNSFMTDNTTRNVCIM